MHPSGFNQVIVIVAFPFILLSTILHICSDIAWSKEPFRILSFFLFYFFCFSPFFDWLISFFSFLFSWSTFITQGKRSLFFFFFSFFFLGKILLFFLPMVRLEISTLSQGYGQKFWFGSNGLRMAGHDACQGICLASGPRIRECPKLFPWHAYDNDD